MSTNLYHKYRFIFIIQLIVLPCTTVKDHLNLYFHKNKTGSTTGNPVNAAFFFDIRNNKQKVIMNGLCDSGKQLDAITEMLTIANPEIRFE